MKTWKEVIRPGTYFYTDESTGQPRRLDVTEQMVRHLHDQGHAMLQAGLSIPVPVEHQREATPLTTQERAARQLLNNAGWVSDYAMRHGNRLFAEVDIQDEQLARKLPTTIKWTSPWLNSFTDGSGKKWEGVITHLALTSRPRITKQEPFGNEKAALSLTQLSDPDSYKAGLFVSRAGLLDRDIGKPGFKPRYPAAFSVLSGAKLAEDYDGEEEKKPPIEKKDGDKPPPGKEPMLDDGMEEKEMEMCDVLCDMVSALWGIDVGEGTTEKNLMQRLLKALLEHLKLDNREMLDEEEEEMAEIEKKEKTPATPSSRAPVVEEPPVFMSLEQVNALPDGDMKKMAMAMLSMQAKTESMQKHLFEDALAVRNARIERLAKKAGRQGYKERLQAQAMNVQLSLEASGKVLDPFAATLDLLEEGIKELPELLVKKTATEVDHPQDAAGMSEERRKQIMEELENNTGIPKGASAA